jgi:uncharacterized membrane protein YgcG
MRKHVVRGAALWLVGAMIAAAGATAAVSFLGTGLFGASGQPLTQADVQQRFARHAHAAAASGQHSPAPSGHGRSRRPAAATPAPGSMKVIPVTGGTVFASCSSGLAKLTWSLAQGYQADGYLAGPARSAWVKLKSGSTEQLVTVTCAGDRPRDVVSAPDVRGGGGGGGGHGGGGRGGGGSGGHDG